MINLNVLTYSDNVSTALDEYKSQTLWNSLLLILGITWDDVEQIILAIIQQESDGNPNALGDDGRSFGLMQLNFGIGTPQSLGFTGSSTDLFNPDTNIQFGVKYFLTQLKRYWNVDKAILAYNAGSYIEKNGVPVNESYLDSVHSILVIPQDYFVKKKNRVTWFLF